MQGSAEFEEVRSTAPPKRPKPLIQVWLMELIGWRGEESGALQR